MPIPKSLVKKHNEQHKKNTTKKAIRRPIRSPRVHHQGDVESDQRDSKSGPPISVWNFPLPIGLWFGACLLSKHPPFLANSSPPWPLIFPIANSPYQRGFGSGRTFRVAHWKPIIWPWNERRLNGWGPINLCSLIAPSFTIKYCVYHIVQYDYHIHCTASFTSIKDLVEDVHFVQTLPNFTEGN